MSALITKMTESVPTENWSHTHEDETKKKMRCDANLWVCVRARFINKPNKSGYIFPTKIFGSISRVTCTCRRTRWKLIICFFFIAQLYEQSSLKLHTWAGVFPANYKLENIRHTCHTIIPQIQRENAFVNFFHFFLHFLSEERKRRK